MPEGANGRNKFSRAMVVVAHADDAEYGCSGTVAKLCDEQWEVVYVLCTNGSKGTSDHKVTQENLVEIRRAEQIAAGKVLGLKNVVFLDYDDSYLQPTLDLRRDIARQIRIHRPDVVMCQHPMRNLEGFWGVGHPDHIAAGEATLAAVFPTARDHLTFPELLASGLEPHNVSEIWIMGHPVPDFWVDVTEYIDVSVKAIMQHESQTEGRSQDYMDDRMRDWRRQQAVGRGMQYAEAFKCINFRS